MLKKIRKFIALVYYTELRVDRLYENQTGGTDFFAFLHEKETKLRVSSEKTEKYLFLLLEHLGIEIAHIPDKYVIRKKETNED